MGELKIPEPLPALFVGIGVATYQYPDSYPHLDKAAPDVKEVCEHLARHGFQTHLFADADLNDSQLRTQLDALLQPDILPRGGCLIILWSGHGKLEKGDLKLIARNTMPKPQANTPTATFLAQAAAVTGASQILLIFDTCYSGGAVFPAADAVAAVQQEWSPDLKQVGVGVISSALSVERATDGAFGNELMKLLRNGPDNADRRNSWSTHNERVRGADFMFALQEECRIDNQSPDVLWHGAAEFMLPNPIFQPPPPDRIDPRLLEAARGGDPGDDRCYFAGRVAQVNRIVDWKKIGKPGALVVAGPPGIGKSAILGRIVSLSHHDERDKLLTQGPLGHADPGEDSVHAHIGSIRHTVDGLVASIDEQLVRKGFLADDPGGTRNREQLLGAIQQTGRCPLIVVDGLNESPECWRIAEDVLRTLSEVSLMLIGTQDLPPRDGPLSLIKALGAKEVIDLEDPAIQQQAETDVRRYVETRLSGVVQPALVPKIADIIFETSRQQDASPFLLAYFITIQVRRTPVDASLPNWREELTHGIRNAFESFIAGLPKPEAAKNLLAALSWSKGWGFTDDIWPIVASALSGTQYERTDVYWLLPKAEHYIVEDGRAGRAVFRLVHQWLADYFQIAEPEPATPQASAIQIAQALVAYYLDLLHAVNDPRRSDYLWRYTWRHCVEAGEPGIAAFHRLVELDEKEFAPQLAAALSVLSKSQARRGLWQRASDNSKEAVAIYARFEGSDPKLPIEHAKALVALARLQILLDPEAGVSAANEAVKVIEAMDVSNRAVRVLLASALTARSSGYNQTGQLEQAVKAAGDAVAILRPMSVDNPAFAPDLADALTYLGLGCFSAGHTSDAVRASEEAAALFENMNAASPDVAIGSALSLAVLGLSYAQTGLVKKGVESARRAVDLFKQLDTSLPALGFLHAFALTALSQANFQAGQAQEAVNAATESIKLFASLDTKVPAAGLLLASARTVLGQGYAQMGRGLEAVATAEDAVASLEKMDLHNWTVRLTLASARTVAGQGFLQTGRPKDAVAAAGAATELLENKDLENKEDGNLTVPFALASARSVAAQGYSQLKLSQNALDAATEVVALLENRNHPDLAVLLLLASARTVRGLSYAALGRDQDSIDEAQKAIKLLENQNTGNPAVSLTKGLALIAGSLGYISNNQKQAGLEAALAGARLLEMKDDDPASRLRYGAALVPLAQAYLLNGKLKEAVEEAAKSAGLLKPVDGGLAQPVVYVSALIVLGTASFQAGQVQQAVNAANEAIQLRSDLARLNRDALPDYADTLGLFDEQYRQAGRGEEIDAHWHTAIDSQEHPAGKAFFMLERIAWRGPKDAVVIGDLIQVDSYLTDADRELHARLHRACRDVRAKNPSEFDAAWRSAKGGELPQWLTLDPALLQTVREWVFQEPVTASRDFLKQKIDHLPSDSTSIALDEIALDLEPRIVEEYRKVLKIAHEKGVDEAYRPVIAVQLLDDWIAADREKMLRIIREHREELLSADVEGILQYRIAQNPENSEFVGQQQLLNLARAGKEDLAFTAFDDPARDPDTLFELARADDVDVLHSLALLLYINRPGPAKGLPLFYTAIALARKDHPEKALEAVAEARRLDPEHINAWLSSLFKLEMKLPDAQRIKLLPLNEALLEPESEHSNS